MRVLTLAALVLVAGCGKQGELMRPVPAGTAALAPDPSQPLPSQLLVLPTQAEPARVDDPLKKSEERQDDRFALPPPG